MGKALYRRYRPKLLAEVVGQNQVTDALKAAMAHGQVAHAYLFVGPRGTGKTSVARILAHEINHFNYELEDDYLDIIEIDAASNTGVENIRDLREKAMIAPSVGEFKVYIIDEVHMLSKSAFNALLKTLEEPPSHVVFIMATTDLNKVPVTIRSRSQVYNFKLVDISTMTTHLRKVADAEKIAIGDDALEIIAKRSGGSFRDAMSLLDQVSLADSKMIDAKIVNEFMGLPEEEVLGTLLKAYKAVDANLIREKLKLLLDRGIAAETIADDLLRLAVESFDLSLLPLAKNLMDVPRSSYPEVSLLLALLGNCGVNFEFNASKKGQAGVEAGSANLGVAPIEQHKIGGDDGRGNVVGPSVAVSDAGASIKAERVTASSAEMNDLKSILVSSGELVGIRRFLEEADFETKGEDVVIYVKKSFVKNQIIKHQTQILSLLPGEGKLEVVVGSREVDETIANIAALMGGGEEVILNE